MSSSISIVDRRSLRLTELHFALVNSKEVQRGRFAWYTLGRHLKPGSSVDLEPNPHVVETDRQPLDTGCFEKTNLCYLVSKQSNKETKDCSGRSRLRW